MKIWFIGLSIYPVSYIVSSIIKLLGSKNYIFELPESIPFMFVITFLEPLLKQFFGADSGQLNMVELSIVYLLFIVILISINTIFFVSIISILPKNWKFIAIIIMYILFVAINSYIPEINL